MNDNTNSGKTVWLIIDHPWQLLLALGLKICAPSDLVFNLLISKHKYWKSMDIGKYQNYFGRIYFFDDPERTHSIKGIVKFLSQMLALKKQVRTLSVGKDDILVTLSYFRYFESIVTSVFAKNQQIFVCREDMYKVLTRSLADIRSNKQF